MIKNKDKALFDIALSAFSRRKILSIKTLHYNKAIIKVTRMNPQYQLRIIFQMAMFRSSEQSDF